MERRGTGLRLIRERTALAPNYEDKYEPEFIDDGQYFKVILWDMNYDADLVIPIPDKPSSRLQKYRRVN